MTFSELKSIINGMDLPYGAYGIRTQEEPFEIGSINHKSLVWVDGEETNEELDGISVTNLDNDRALRMHCSDYNLRDGFYYGDHVAIITGDEIATGEDLGEIILENAEVIAIIS